MKHGNVAAGGGTRANLVATPGQPALTGHQASLTGATVPRPGPGIDRIYAYIRDGKGGGATANLPRLVEWGLDGHALGAPAVPAGLWRSWVE